MTSENLENKQEKKLIQEQEEKKIASEQQQPVVEQKAKETKAEEDAKEDPNWRAFREARKKDRADKEAAERRATEKEAEAAALKAAMEAAFAKGNYPSSQSGSQDGFSHEETEDERIEKKVNALLAEREKKAQQEASIREQQEYPNRLQQAYPDFNAMVSSENLDYLEYHYPEIARPLKRLGDGFDKWSDIYHAVKKFVPNATTARKEAAKAEANLNKPKSISSTGLTQSTEGKSSLTEERKAANWERMNRVMKGVG